MAHEATIENRAKVTALATFGIKEKIIADYMRVSLKTLRLKYADEIRVGQSQGIATISKVLFEQAKAGSVPAINTYLKMVGALTDNVSISNPDGSPLMPTVIQRVVIRPGDPIPQDEPEPDDGEDIEGEYQLEHDDKGVA